MTSDTLCHVDHEQRDVGLVDRTQRTEYRVVLGALVDLAPPAHARGVDETNGAPLGLDNRVDRVACRARHIMHDRPVFADEAIEERRLAHIRAAHDGDRKNAVFLGNLGIDQ